MNPETGKVLIVDDNAAAMKEKFDALNDVDKTVPLREWVKFEIGEEINVKGIKLKVHDVSDQRLVLKFKGE